MISKAVLYNTLVIWGFAQVTFQVTISRSGAPVSGRPSMIANGWRPLTSYEGNANSGHHPNPVNNGASNVITERHSGPHPVHGKLHEHMVSSEKLAAKKNKQTQDYSPPSILGSFSAFGHSVPKNRNNNNNNNGETVKGHANQVTSETREYTFLIPPPREPVRYDIDPYRKVIVRDNDAYLRQPGQQYIIPHSIPQTDIRTSQFFTKGASVSPGVHVINHSKNRPLVTEYNSAILPNPQQHQSFRQQQQQQQQQQHVPFESLKLSNAKLYLQPPSNGGSVNFASEQQASDNLYNRYSTGLTQHNGPMHHDGNGNFYSQINHPIPSFKTHGLDRDPGFLIHESHEVSYPTQASPVNGAYGNFRPSTPYDNVFPPERYSTARPNVVQADKFLPSKAEKLIRKPNVGYGQYGQNGHSENSVVSSEPGYSNGIANTYYISDQQSLTPPASTWSVSGNNKPTPDINEVLPKTSRPPKFNNDPASIDEVRQKNRQQIADYLLAHSDVQQKPMVQQNQQQHHYSGNPLALINQQVPETVYDTPESISLKHFNEEQFKLQQQLLQRDRDRLREQELQRQQQEMEFERITSLRNKEKATTTTTTTTTTTLPIQETPNPTVQYIDTTVVYQPENYQGQNQQLHFISPQQAFGQQYEQHRFEPVRPNGDHGVTYETPGVSPVSESSVLTSERPAQDFVIYDTTEAPPNSHRNRPRKPTTSSTSQHEQQYRRRKPTTTPFYEEHQQFQQQEYQQQEFQQQEVQQQEFQHLSTLAPDPTVPGPESSFPQVSSTEEPTPAIEVTSPAPETTQSSTASLDYEPTRPRNRRPGTGNSAGGRRRRPTTTTTPEPETEPSVTYEEPDLVKYKKSETDASRRRRVKPTTTQSHYEETTSTTEKKKNEIRNYGNKLGQNEQFVTEDSVTVPEPVTLLDSAPEQVSETHGYTSEQDGNLYTPTYEPQVTADQVSTEYESSRYPTSAIPVSTQDSTTEQRYVDYSEPIKNVHTSIPLEDLFVNTERTTTSTPSSTTTTTTTTTTEPTTTFPTTRVSVVKSTRVATSSPQSSTARLPSHRIRPMRFGNSTRPRFSIKDYKSRLDYRNRMSSTTTESPASSNAMTRHKVAVVKNQYDSDNQDGESITSTTGRYRHMSRISHRMTSTTPSYHSRRTEANDNSTTDKTNKFTPKRRLYGNHLYRSKIATSTTPDPNQQTVDSTTSKYNSVRHENVYSSAIRRRPQMKLSIYPQSSDVKSSRKDANEMVPEETSYYPSAVSQLLTDIVTNPSGQDTDRDDVSTQSVKLTEINDEQTVVTSTTAMEPTSTNDTSNIESSDEFQSMKTDDSNTSEHSLITTDVPNDFNKTEDPVKTESPATINSQTDDDLFAKASQSVADLTSSASALYNKPGMFKAVSISPSAAESAMISGRFRIAQERPTLPIEAFFHELSHKNHE